MSLAVHSWQLFATVLIATVTVARRLGLCLRLAINKQSRGTVSGQYSVGSRYCRASLAWSGSAPLKCVGQRRMYLELYRPSADEVSCLGRSPKRRHDCIWA